MRDDVLLLFDPSPEGRWTHRGAALRIARVNDASGNNRQGRVELWF